MDTCEHAFELVSVVGHRAAFPAAPAPGGEDEIAEVFVRSRDSAGDGTKRLPEEGEIEVRARETEDEGCAHGVADEVRDAVEGCENIFCLSELPLGVPGHTVHVYSDGTASQIMEDLREGFGKI